jgi:hypothetical protein
MKIVVCLFLLFVTSCSSEFSNPFLMPPIEIDKEDLLKGKEKSFYIQNFEDQRKDKVFIKFNEQSYSSDAEVESVVRESLTKALVDKGFKYSKDAKYIFKIYILEWQGEAKDDIFSTLNTSAEIQTDIFDKGGKKIFSGKYQGKSSVDKLTLNNEDALIGLSTAMKVALLKFVNSKELQDLLFKSN